MQSLKMILKNKVQSLRVTLRECDKHMQKNGCVYTPPEFCELLKKLRLFEQLVDAGAYNEHLGGHIGKPLTDYEKLIARLTSQGMKAKEIARKLDKEQGSIYRTQEVVRAKTGLETGQFRRIFEETNDHEGCIPQAD